jgi:toxin ParE1/3/4
VKRPRVVLGDLAIADILEQADWYNEQSGSKLARRWENAITSTVLRMAEKPRAGALCKFSAEELRDVRRVPVAGFPRHLVFYQFRGNEIFVLRVIHGARDLESLF